MELLHASISPTGGPFSTSQRNSRVTSAGLPSGKVRVTETPPTMNHELPFRSFILQMRS